MKKLLKWLASARAKVTVVLVAAPVALQVLVLVGVIPSTTATKAAQVVSVLAAWLTNSPFDPNAGKSPVRPSGNQ